MRAISGPAVIHCTKAGELSVIPIKPPSLFIILLDHSSVHGPDPLPWLKTHVVTSVQRSCL